jgi:hypothetical protein
MIQIIRFIDRVLSPYALSPTFLLPADFLQPWQVQPALILRVSVLAILAGVAKTNCLPEVLPVLWLVREKNLFCIFSPS